LENKVGKVAFSGLGDVAAALTEIFEGVVVTTDADLPVQNGDRGRGCPAFPDDRFDLPGHGDVLRVGHAVGDDRRFESHNRFIGKQRFSDFVAITDVFVHNRLRYYYSTIFTDYKYPRDFFVFRLLF